MDIERSNRPEVFVQTLNPMKGKAEWKVQPGDYDYQQEVARSAFADMLHDTERNRLYHVGLKAAIGQKRAAGEKIHVLDIGTGTGLLAMMAASLGADQVTAIEEFAPMSACAENIMKANRLWDQIHLIRKRSTDVRCGPGQDMTDRANILVTEVFDTELIGEGAISTFNHAHNHLLTDNSLVVPCEATMYAQVVNSRLASRWNRLHPFDATHGLTVDPPPHLEAGCSSLLLHDVQLSQMEREWFEPITAAVPVFRFDFNLNGKGEEMRKNERTTSRVKAVGSGSCDALFVWWEAYMDPDKTVKLSCAPAWARRPDGERKPPAWRDHWMQAIYYPLTRIDAVRGQDLTIVSNHDEYSFRFDVGDQPPSHPEEAGGIDLAVSRTRLGQMNDADRNRKYVRCMETMLRRFRRQNDRLPSRVLCLSELSVLPVLFAALCHRLARELDAGGGGGGGKVNVLVCETNWRMREVTLNYFAQNSVANVEFLEGEIADITASDLLGDVDMVIGEPNFSSSLLPWHNLFFWFSLASTFHLDDGGGGGVQEGGEKKIRISKDFVMPRGATVWAVPVAFDHLWKIRAPLGSVEGFDMAHFDALVMNACDASDANVEPHPLWEYPCKALGRPHPLVRFDFGKSVKDLRDKVRLPLGGDAGNLNGVALWVEWHLDDSTTVSTGPTRTVEFGEQISWDVHSKQGVHFVLRHKNAVDLPSPSFVNCVVNFVANEGELLFDFSPS